MTAAIVLQARFASRRLPGKALESIGGRTILARCLHRLQLGGSAPVVLATTERRDDDAVAAEGERCGVRVFRGEVDDVLARFVMVADALGVDYIVRATADNPAVDMNASARVLHMIDRMHADHVVETALPYGAAVEAVSADALRRAHAMAAHAEDREHVTPLIRRDRERFRAATVLPPVPFQRPDVRVTVDTPEDLSYMRRVFGAVTEPVFEPSLLAIIAAADSLLHERRAS